MSLNIAYAPPRCASFTLVLYPLSVLGLTTLMVNALGGGLIELLAARQGWDWR